MNITSPVGFSRIVPQGINPAIQGEFNRYDGGGYVVNFGETGSNVLLLNDILRLNNWIDRLTRVIIVEFTIYNANSNLFTVTRLIVETPEVGGIALKQDIHSFRPYPYVTPWDFVVLVLQIAWIILVVYYIVDAIRSIVKQRGEYFGQFWNWVQLLMLCLCVTDVVMFIMRTRTIIGVVERVKNAKGRCQYRLR